MRAAVGLLVLAISGPAAAGITTLEELEACASRNLPGDSSVQVVALRSRDRVEQVSESRAKVYWKKFDDGLSRVMLRITDPIDQRGAGVLLIEKKDSRADIFMYMPELGKVRRVTSRMVSGSLFGTDFSYEDFERIQGYAKDGSSELRATQEIEGRPAVVVEGRPDPESGSAYERTLAWFDQEMCIPIKVELYESGERLRKILTTDLSKVGQENASYVPRRMVMKDLRDETQTELVVEEIDFDAKIKRKIFSERELEAGGR